MLAHLRAAALVLAALAPSLQPAPRPATSAIAPVLRDLGGVDELRALFDADRGRIRVVLLLSPT